MSDFETSIAQWKSSILALEALAKILVDSEAAAAPVVGDAANVQNLHNVLDNRKTVATPVPKQLKAAMLLWNPKQDPQLKNRLLKPLYQQAMQASRYDNVSELINTVVTHGLVTIRQTGGPKQLVSDAKGAKGAKDVGVSTEYALEGLSKITVHVHWVVAQVGNQVAGGESPAHWKTKGARMQLGVSTKIPNSLAIKIHNKALDKREN